jgi:hypothetical protein
VKPSTLVVTIGLALLEIAVIYAFVHYVMAAIGHPV